MKIATHGILTLELSADETRRLVRVLAALISAKDACSLMLWSGDDDLAVTLHKQLLDRCPILNAAERPDGKG